MECKGNFGDREWDSLNIVVASSSNEEPANVKLRCTVYNRCNSSHTCKCSLCMVTDQEVDLDLASFVDSRRYIYKIILHPYIYIYMYIVYQNSYHYEIL